MYTVQELLAIFWNAEFWLPPGITWEDFDPKEEYDHTNYRHLYLYPIPFTAGILLFRFVLEKFCFRRLGLIFGLKSTRTKKASNNPVLEKAYALSTRWSHKDITALAKQTDCSDRQIERWLRLRKIQDKPSTLFKFSESCWRCFYYTNMTIYGFVMLWPKPWFWNLDHCWTNYPHQGLSSDIWWYYMISLSFYWSLFISQFFDTKRKDFWQMCLHHIITILLLSFSWICNMFRIGCILLIIHDVADAILDACKACKYAKCDRLLNFLFVIFVIVWYATKLVYYPFWVLHNGIFRSFRVCGLMFPSYYFFNGLMVGLFFIHVYWSYLIFKILMKTIVHGKVEGDIRSEDESE